MTAYIQKESLLPLRHIPFDADAIPQEITEWDDTVFTGLISNELTETHQAIITSPSVCLPKETSIIAVHWHPEFIPMDWIRLRIDATFPNLEESIIIPTQHNELLTWDSYSGVEIDCFDKSFHRKVQLLLHFHHSRVKDASVLKSMLKHTYTYRASQLYDLVHSLISPDKETWIQKAAVDSGSNEEILQFVRIYSRKFEQLLEKYEAHMSPDLIKNKLLRNYFNALSERYERRFIQHAQLLIKLMKEEVKRHFPFHYFYEVNEIIEEVRSLNGGIVVPHPEQFWPILLANHDVDGYEVWNPQSREFTDFLIDVVIEKNKMYHQSQKPLLIFMGDDTHMGEKILPVEQQAAEKYNREIGVQPEWNDLNISKKLVKGAFSKTKIIQEYKNRLT